MRENLDPLRQFSEDETRRAMLTCRLSEMESFKERGLDSFVSVSGGNLSVGEKQLVVIGRTVLLRRKVVLVDEATANIDKQNEAVVRAVFEECFREVCVVTIAHKITTIMESDRIIVLSSGEVVEQDSPEKLLANPGSEFREMVRLNAQFEGLL